MASDDSDTEVLHSFLFFNVLKNGKVNVFNSLMDKIPPADDPITGVKIKDVQISTDVSARMFLPPSATATTTAKLPVLLYIHGGGFCMRSAFSENYTDLLTRLVTAGNILAVSVEYRLFPATSIAACYDDSWAALQWIAAHATGPGPDPWLARHADFNKVYVGGNSAGGTISHILVVRAGSDGLPGGVNLAGVYMVHPYFGEDDKMWMYMCPDNEGPRDPRMCPSIEDMKKIKCGKVLVFVGEKDGLRDAGIGYVEKLKKSEWKGTVELVENKDRGHCFNTSDPEDVESIAIQQKIISFMYDDHSY